MIAGDNPFVAAGGAIIGETVGELYRDQTWGSDRPPLGTSEEESAKTTRIGTALAQVTAGTAAALLGQNPTPASHAAEVAVRNNCVMPMLVLPEEMLRAVEFSEAEEERIGLDFLRDVYGFVEEAGERHPTFWRGVGRAFEGVEWVMEQVNEAIPPLYWLNQGIGYGIETWVDSKASIGRTSAEVAANARALSGLLQLGSRSTLVLGGVTAGARGTFGRTSRFSKPGVLVVEEAGFSSIAENALSIEARGLELIENSSLAKTTISNEIQNIFINHYSGGGYGKLERIAGFERHHMPADSVTTISRARGPAIQMLAEDHAKTSSYGNSLLAQAYRERVRSLIEESRFRDAMAREIWDVRKSTGTKYNEAMKEMLSYAEAMGYLGK